MAVLPPSSTEYNSPQRRSQRVIVKTPVVLLTRGEDGKVISENTRTVTVNAHGAMVVSGLKLQVGQIVTLHNSRSEEEASCRVVYLSPHQTDKREIGMEFLEPHPKFWLISFPPDDWTPKHPEAKGSTNPSGPSTPKKKK